MNVELRRKLDRMANVLWGSGTTNPVTYIEQLSYLIYLKLLDEEESLRQSRENLMGVSANGNRKSLFPLQAERYRWSKWRFKSGPELLKHVRDEVFPYLRSLSMEAPETALYFSDANLEIQDPSALKQVVDEIDGIEFSKLGPDTKGEVYEYLLGYLGKVDATTLGQFRTPRQIRAMMVQLIDPDAGDTIFDPACGTGGFLVDAVEHVLSKYSGEAREVPIYGEEWLEKYGKTIEQAKVEIPTLQTYKLGGGEKIPDWLVFERSVYGVDVAKPMVRITVMNLVLHGITHASVKRANALAQVGGLSEDDRKRRYSVVLSNPPFAGILPKDSLRDDLPTNSKKSELLFLSVMMTALAPGGKCAVVVPEGLLFGSTAAHTELRRHLIEDFDVLAVISLPAGVFKPYAGVKTGVLVFRNPVKSALGERKTPRQDKVWFYDVRADGYDPDKISGGGRPETPDRNDIPDLLRQWAEYKGTRFTSPPGVESGTLLPPDTEEPRCWWVPVKAIADNDYNLAAGRYRPQIAEKMPDEDPVQLVREMLQTEREIAIGLEKLLQDMETAQ
ncbi:MAG: class I SAM-dependent DNA methyltransferase [Candidatus Brocadiia bacterium]